MLFLISYTCELFKPFFHRLSIRKFWNVKEFARNTVETRETFRILLFKTSDKITIQKSYILFKRFLRTFHPFPDLNVFSYSTFNTGFPFYISLLIEILSKVKCMWFTCPSTKGTAKLFLKIYDPYATFLMYTKLHINGSHLK